MPFDLDHGDISALGFRFGALAYTPDVKRIPEASRPFLEGLDMWIIDALRYRPHPSHFSLDEALVVDRDDASAARDPHQLAYRSRLRDLAREAARACDAGL